MKITKSLVVFFLAFFIGSLAIWLIKSFSSVKNETVIESIAITKLPEIRAVEEKTKLRTFNVEGFWDESANRRNERLLVTGDVTNIEDIKAKSGEMWFGLFSKNGKDFLRQTKIKVSLKREHDLDWKNVSVMDKTEPLFLLKKSNLKTGEVRTLLREKAWNESDELSESATIKASFYKKFILGKREYTLRAEKGLSEKQEPILVLLLETENTSQIIHYVDYYADFSDEGTPLGNLDWIGDLDGDGKLDLYLDFWNYEKGYYNSGLFLSTEAGNGKLVGKIEYFLLSAC